MRRQWAASETADLGWGGESTVAMATGLARNTIMAGARELEHRREHPKEAITVRIRRMGAGRKPLTETGPELQDALAALVDPVTRGRPESPLLWTCKSTAKLAAELRRQEHVVSERAVAAMLKAAGYGLQANSKTREGSSHPDRNAQCEQINRQVLSFQRGSQPVVSVDTKKKELVGEFKNPGQEWEIKGEPTPGNVHDFPDPRLGKAIPYGVCDLASNEGWMSVGIDHDRARYAAASIHRWWQELGSERFPRASRLMITADGGGSNSRRNRLWKVALQDLADQIGLRLDVCHFPPGTSKWNKIEHRLFCFMTKNWRGRPLTGYEVMVNLIANTTTKAGLVIRAALDTTEYETGINVRDEELARMKITKSTFHGDWNYAIHPRR